MWINRLSRHTRRSDFSQRAIHTRLNIYIFFPSIPSSHWFTEARFRTTCVFRVILLDTSLLRSLTLLIIWTTFRRLCFSSFFPSPFPPHPLVRTLVAKHLRSRRKTLLLLLFSLSRLSAVVKKPSPFHLCFSVSLSFSPSEDAIWLWSPRLLGCRVEEGRPRGCILHVLLLFFSCCCCCFSSPPPFLPPDLGQKE